VLPHLGNAFVRGGRPAFGSEHALGRHGTGPTRKVDAGSTVGTEAHPRERGVQRGALGGDDRIARRGEVTGAPMARPLTAAKIGLGTE